MGRTPELRLPHGRFDQDDAIAWYYSSSIRPLGRSVRSNYASGLARKTEQSQHGDVYDTVLCRRMLS
eukprot:7809192-Pyramimonas_sp.AAC.1